MLDARALIEKHRGKGVFVDTNLLVLLLVGSVNTKRILDFKRTQDFTVEDFHTLRSLVNWFGTPLVATPHVLSQVSDLTALSGHERTAIRRLFQSTIEVVEESYGGKRNNWFMAGPDFSDELIAILRRGFEGKDPDYKGPMSWDENKETCCAIVKDILGMANTAGGNIVFGVSDPDNGFFREGLSSEQCGTFDTTRLNWFLQN
jgi:hypothetical protein